MKFPRVMIAAPHSGSGKTTIVCGLLQALKDMGHAPCSFKCGPDYIDPMYHRKVLHIPSGNLDTFFTEPKTTMSLFQEEYQGDVAIIEGVMGLFDGIGGIEEEGSSYDLAYNLLCPIVLVVDARGAGKSVLAQIKGFLDYDKYGLIQAVILNKTSPEFGKILKPLIEKELGIQCLGVMPNEKNFTLGSRHLGLVLPDEIKDMKSRQREVANALIENISLEDVLKIANSAEELEEVKQQELFSFSKTKKTLRLAVARDEAFCFYYRENLSLLQKAGIEILEFSPLRDKRLPENISGLLLGGGYPENYLSELSQNVAMKTAIKEAFEKGIPTLAECGGFLYLLDEIKDDKDTSYQMVGAIEGSAFWTGRLTRFGYISVSDKKELSIKAHEFHYYDTDNNGEDCIAKKPTGNRNWQCIHNIHGGYIGFPHFYYPSNVEFVIRFAESMERYLNSNKSKDWDETG